MDNLKDLEAMHVALKEFRTIGKRNREILLNMLTKEHEVVGDTVEDPYHEIKERFLVGGGRSNANGLIPFIRDVRNKSKETPGIPALGLKEAKDLVESW